MCVCMWGGGGSACVVYSNYVRNEFVRKMHGSHHTIYSILIFYGTLAMTLF